MWVKYFIITLLFFLFSILQHSFLPYLNIMGAMLNLVFILFFIVVISETPVPYDNNSSLPEKLIHPISSFAVLVAGFFLDVGIDVPFGVSTVLLICIYVLVSLMTHMVRERSSKYMGIYFLLLFAASYLIYYGGLYIVGLMFSYAFSFGTHTWVGLAYNGVVALIGYYLFHTFFTEKGPERQLRLLR